MCFIAAGNGAFPVLARSPARLFLFEGSRAQGMLGRLMRLYGRGDSRTYSKNYHTGEGEALVTGESNILGFLIKSSKTDTDVSASARWCSNATEPHQATLASINVVTECSHSMLLKTE